MGYTSDVFRCGICCEELFNIEDYARHMVIQEQCHVVLSPCKILHDLLLPRFKPTGDRSAKLDSGTQTYSKILEEPANAVKVLTGESPSDVRWKCRLCNLTFSRLAALSNHSALVHSSSLHHKQGQVKDDTTRYKKPKVENLVHSNVLIKNLEHSHIEDLCNAPAVLQDGTVSNSFLVNDITLLPRLYSETNLKHPLNNASENERDLGCYASCINNDSENQPQYSNKQCDTNPGYFSSVVHSKKTTACAKLVDVNASTNTSTTSDIKNAVLGQETDSENVHPAIHISPDDSGSLQPESKPLVTLKVSDEFHTKDVHQTNFSEVQVVADDDDPELLEEQWETNNPIIDLEKQQNVIDLDFHESGDKDDDILSIYELNGLSCKHCSETFKTSRTLQQHLSIVHAPHKPYVCAFQDCGQAFKTKGSLTRHHRRHTGERPYMCGVCGRSFRESGTLHRHRQSKVSCANKTDSQFTRYRAALPLPHADSKACLAKLLLKKEEVLCGEDSRGAMTSATPDDSRLLTATETACSTSTDNVSATAIGADNYETGKNGHIDQGNRDEPHQKPVTFAAGRVIKQERIEAKHQQATTVMETEPIDQWGEGGHKNKQQLSLLSIKEEAGGRLLLLQPPSKPRCKLECPEPEPSPSDEEETQWEEPESPSSLSHPPDSPGSVTSLNPSLVDVPPYPMLQFDSDNRFGDYGPWEDEAEGDGVQSPGDSRDIKPRLALADIKPRVNSATPDIKPRFHPASLEEADPPDFHGHLPHDALPLDYTAAPCTRGRERINSIIDVAPSAASQSDDYSVNCAGTTAGGTSPASTLDKAEAVRSSHPHYSMLPFAMSKIDCASVINSVDHNTPVSGVNVDCVASVSQLIDSSGFPDAAFKSFAISGTPVPPTSSAVSEGYGSDLHPPVLFGLKKSVLADLPLSGDRRDVVGHPLTSAAPNTSIAVAPSLVSDFPADDASQIPDVSIARVPAVVTPTDAQAPHTATVARPLPSVNTAARDESSEPLKVVFNCPHCDRSFDARSALMTHLYTHYNKLGPQCSECNKSFSSRQGVVRHLVRHASVRRFVCTQCSQHFSHPSQLLQHRLSHSEHKPVLCNVCGRSFKTVSSRNLHGRAAHAGAREECGVCGRMFTTRGSLQRHQRTHSGARPFACRHCAAAFRDRGTLARHLRYKKPCCILDKTPPNTEPEQVTLNDAASVIHEDNEEELETEIYDSGRYVDLIGHHTSNISVPLSEQLLRESQRHLGKWNNSIRVMHRLDNPATHEIILDLNNPLEKGHLGIGPEVLDNTDSQLERFQHGQVFKPSMELDTANNLSAEEEEDSGGGDLLEYIFDPSSVENRSEGRELEMLNPDEMG